MELLARLFTDSLIDTLLNPFVLLAAIALVAALVSGLVARIVEFWEELL